MSRYSAKILADSVSPDGIRLTSFEIVMPRFILAEFNTHRTWSRNSASSRAIPTERLIEQVVDHAFVPETFNARVRGMGVGEPLEGIPHRRSTWAWLNARDHAVAGAQRLLELNVDKSRANRLLEPFMWHTVICTGTEFRNFYALRTHETAQPEFRVVAGMMLDAHRASEPIPLEPGRWHLPLVYPEDVAATNDARDPTMATVKISAGRCARVSYDRHGDDEPRQTSIERHDRLVESGHLSPLEHQARPLQMDDLAVLEGMWGNPTSVDAWEATTTWSGNLRGWHQYRKQVPYEDDAWASRDEELGI